MPGRPSTRAREMTRLSRHATCWMEPGTATTMSCDDAPNRTPPTFPVNTVCTPAGVMRWPVAMTPGSAMARAGVARGLRGGLEKRGDEEDSRHMGWAGRLDVRGWDAGRMSTYQRPSGDRTPPLCQEGRFDEPVTRRWRKAARSQ